MSGTPFLDGPPGCDLGTEPTSPAGVGVLSLISDDVASIV